MTYFHECTFLSLMWRVLSLFDMRTGCVFLVGSSPFQNVNCVSRFYSSFFAHPPNFTFSTSVPRACYLPVSFFSLLVDAFASFLSNFPFRGIFESLDSVSNPAAVAVCPWGFSFVWGFVCPCGLGGDRRFVRRVSWSAGIIPEDDHHRLGSSSLLIIIIILDLPLSLSLSSLYLIPSSLIQHGPKRKRSAGGEGWGLRVSVWMFVCVMCVCLSGRVFA